MHTDVCFLAHDQAWTVGLLVMEVIYRRNGVLVQDLLTWPLSYFVSKAHSSNMMVCHALLSPWL